MKTQSDPLCPNLSQKLFSIRALFWDVGGIHSNGTQRGKFPWQGSAYRTAVWESDTVISIQWQ